MSTAATSQGVRNVGFMLENFVRSTAGVEQAIGVSADGLLMSMAVAMARPSAEKLAATVTGMTTLAVGAGTLLNKGGLAQVITEYQNGYLVTSLITGRSALGVVTGAECDLGVVGYETTMLVQRIGAVLTPDLVTELKAAMLR